MPRTLSNKAKRDAEIIYAAMKLIQSNGNEMRWSDIKAQLPSKIELTAKELEPTKTWEFRWLPVVQMVAIEIKKAGYLNTNKGVWYLTDEGEKALEAGAEAFFIDFHSKYRNQITETIKQSDSIDEENANNRVPVDILISNSRDEIKEYIKKKDAYDFQFMVAALFRAMGYFTSFIAPKGRDGGIDIIAYCDPLGVKKPHIKIQVKHYPNNPITVDVVRSLVGVLRHVDEIGFVVTSGSFTSEAKREARGVHSNYIRLIDFDEFIDLWIAYYSNMPDEDKALLPITPVYYLNI